MRCAWCTDDAKGVDEDGENTCGASSCMKIEALMPRVSEDEDPDDYTDEYEFEPDACQECGSGHRMMLVRADVNGEMRMGWICDDCRRFHAKVNLLQMED